jgi:hypothetical protein
MKVATKLILAFYIITSQVACDSKHDAKVEPKTQLIPKLTLTEIMNMTKNERQELERRCLGVSHETCSLLKSESFENLKRLHISGCIADASMKGLSSAEEGARARRKCDDLF